MDGVGVCGMYGELSEWCSVVMRVVWKDGCCGWGEWVVRIVPRGWGRIEWSDVCVAVGWVLEWEGGSRRCRVVWYEW